MTALDLVSGSCEQLPHIRLLHAIVSERAEAVGMPRLQAWLRADRGAGAPLALLAAGDYERFEAELQGVSEVSIVITKRNLS